MSDQISRFIRTDLIVESAHFESSTRAHFSVAFINEREMAEDAVERLLSELEPESETKSGTQFIWHHQNAGHHVLALITSILRIPNPAELAEQEIVVERSPPTLMTLLHLLDAAQSVGVTTRDGAAMALAYLPFGVAVMRAASVVGKGVGDVIVDWMKVLVGPRKAGRVRAPAKAKPETAAKKKTAKKRPAAAKKAIKKKAAKKKAKKRLAAR